MAVASETLRQFHPTAINSIVILTGQDSRATTRGAELKKLKVESAKSRALLSALMTKTYQPASSCGTSSERNFPSDKWITNDASWAMMFSVSSHPWRRKRLQAQWLVWPTKEMDTWTTFSSDSKTSHPAVTRRKPSKRFRQQRKGPSSRFGTETVSLKTSVQRTIC